MSIAKPFTFVAGQKARANEVNADFDTLYTQVNINIADIAQLDRDIDNVSATKANINGSSTQRFAVANPVSSTDAVNKQTLTKSIGNSLDLISGLTIGKDSGSPNDTILVQPGSAYDSTKAVVLTLANITSKKNSNQAANATYYVYIIGNTTGSSIDILISTSSTVPTLPTGYTLYRQIGSYTTDTDKHIDKISYYGINLNSPVSSIFEISNIMPDYSAGVAISSESTVPVDSVGYADCTNTGNNELYVDDVLILHQVGQGSYRQWVGTTFLLPKDSVIRYSGCTGVKYFPLKGAR